MKVPRPRPYGELVPLPIPRQQWEGIALDFIVQLPPSKRRGVVYDAILACGGSILEDGPVHCLYGDHRSRKLADKFLGPFTVVEIVRLNAYRLDQPKRHGKIHSTFHISLLEPNHRRAARTTPRAN